MSVDKIEEFWNKRYKNPGYAYGSEPNTYFKSIIDKLVPGKILIPAAGQGRDAVYAASLGWEVDAFDLSEEGKRTALEFAQQKDVEINFEVQNAFTFYTEKKYDLIALIYFHIPATKRNEIHERFISFLSPNGLLLLEAFNKKQVNNKSGGPNDINMLMSIDELKSDFSNLICIECDESFVHLNEGEYHVGDANIIRYLGRL